MLPRQFAVNAAAEANQTLTLDRRPAPRFNRWESCSMSYAKARNLLRAQETPTVEAFETRLTETAQSLLSVNEEGGAQSSASKLMIDIKLILCPTELKA